MRWPANWNRLRPFLWPVAMIYHALVWWRNLYYRVGFFVSKSVPVPVVSVGNLTVGGTGKTPAVIFLAQHLRQMGYRPGILSRGYGRKSKGTVLVSDGVNVLATYGQSGDEPALMARRLNEVPLVVDENRHRGAQALISRAHPDVIILDDGFQHRGLARECDLVLMDAGMPPRDYHMFPFGRLREPLSAIKRSSAVIWTRTERYERPDPIGKRVSQLGMPEITSSMVAEPELMDLSTGGRVAVSTLDGREIVAFCGLAQPRQFYHSLRDVGVEPDRVRYFPDHHDYTPSDFEELSQLFSRSGGVMITTEKDAVKLPAEFLGSQAVYALRINFAIVGPELEKLTALLLDCLPAPAASAEA